MPLFKWFAATIMLIMILAIQSGCATTATTVDDGILPGPAYRPRLKPEIANLDVARKNLAGLISGENAKVIGIKTPAIPSSCAGYDGPTQSQKISQGAPGKAVFYCGAGDKTLYVLFTDYKFLSNGISASDTVFIDNNYLFDSDIVVEKIPFQETKLSNIWYMAHAIDNRPIMLENSPRPYRISFRGGNHLYFVKIQEAAAFADNLHFIQQRLKSKHDEQAAEFTRKATSYREAKVKPAVTEEQRRLIVQANAMNQRKDYAKAVDLYLQAIEVDPVAYPGAYFNLALLSAQMERYKPAISYMKQYLMLEPNSKDARSAQDKIYEWEGLLEGK